MKWYQSLKFKISLIFLIAFAGIAVMGIQFVTSEVGKEKFKIERYSNFIYRSSFDRRTRDFNADVVEEEGFERVNNFELLEDIEDAKHRQERFMSPFEDDKRGHRKRVEVVHYKGDFYAIFSNHGEEIVFKTPFHTTTKRNLLLFVAVLIFLGGLYIMTLRSIKPLGQLRRDIEAFANGDYDVKTNVKNSDEIGLLAKTFNESVEKIKHLRDARQLFLRNIMHELKTPITKGKLSAEMIEDSSYKEKLKKVFQRQEHLLEEFLRIEKFGAGEVNLEKEDFHLEDILAQVCDILDEKTEHVDFDIQPINVNVDFDLFSVALKNIIDNGINYSSDSHVHVKIKENKLTISNQGKPLEHSLEKYKEPYFLEGKKQKESRGLGFGLFIASHIFELHNMPLKYRHDGNKSYFEITLNKS